MLEIWGVIETYFGTIFDHVRIATDIVAGLATIVLGLGWPWLGRWFLATAYGWQNEERGRDRWRKID